MRCVIVGGTGNVGRKIVECIAASSLCFDSIHIVCSHNSKGTSVPFKNTFIISEVFDDFVFHKDDFVFLAVSSKLAASFVPTILQHKCIVIDNSSYWRMDDSVPLVVPEVNFNAIHNIKDRSQGILIANPNCSTIPICVALRNVISRIKIKRMVVSTYQSVSGAGYAAVEQLYSEVQMFFRKKKLLPRYRNSPFTKRIAFNVIPHIDSFMEDGRTREEWKVESEMRKIFAMPHLGIQVTAVRVPVFLCHAASVCFEALEKSTVENIANLMKGDGVHVTYDEHYDTPVDCEEKNGVYVSRLRKDHTVEKGFCFWIVSDNLLKGAALNAVQIAEKIYFHRQ